MINPRIMAALADEVIESAWTLLQCMSPLLAQSGHYRQPKSLAELSAIYLMAVVASEIRFAGILRRARICTRMILFK